MHALLVTRALASAVVGVVAAATPAQGFAHNRLEFANWWITVREDLFPNYLTPAGNAAGDGLFKVLPGELLERGEDHQLSGYQFAFSIDDTYAGAFPVTRALGAMQLHATRELRVFGRDYEVVDPSRPIGPRFDPVMVAIPADNAWVVEVLFDPANRNPNTRQLLRIPAAVGASRAGIAMLILAEPGERRDPATAGVVLQSSFGERHFAPGRDSYSGSYDATRGAIRMFGTSGMPSATGELYLSLRFDSPTLQLAGPSAGGVANDPTGFETELGPGAYATDLASTLVPGSVRLLVQAAQFDPGGAAPTHFALPLLVAARRGPTTTVSVGGAAIRFDPAAAAFAGALLAAGISGRLDRIPAASGAGFDVDLLGAWSSAPIPVPPSSALIGAATWLQAAIVDPGFAPVAATNAVRLTLQ